MLRPRSFDLPPMVSFVAPSGTGKTTLVEAVVASLIARGHRGRRGQADAHRIELDTEGKDSAAAPAGDAKPSSSGPISWRRMSDASTPPALDELVRLFFADHDP
ncbi:MAG: molybdopterin-guanine dinucleotide biosynthesis protein MobB [Acidimicrobiales bacterium]